MNASPAANPSPKKVVVCDYYTFVSDGRSVKRVRSAKPATLDLIEDLAAEAVPGTFRHVEPHEVNDLGFLRSTWNS